MKYFASMILSLLMLQTLAQNNISSIKMQRTACFGRCPEYTVQLFKNGDVHYTGKKNVPNIGTFRSKINPRNMSLLLNEINKQKLDELQDVYVSKAADLPRLNFTFELKGHTKTIKNADNGPAFLAALGKKIDSIVATVKLEEYKPSPSDDEGPQINMNVDHDKHVSVFQKMPEFPGGEAALMKYLSTHIKYPQQAKDKKIEGKVVCEFTVDEKGNIKNIQLVKGLGGGCNEEAVRVIKKMPRWKPGTANGKAVESTFTLPIVFALDTPKSE